MWERLDYYFINQSKTHEQRSCHDDSSFLLFKGELMITIDFEEGGFLNERINYDYQTGKTGRD